MNSRWQRLAIGAEVSIVAYSTFVSIADDASLGPFTRTQGSVAMYAIMTVETLRNWWNMLPKIDKSMPRVCLTIIFYTHRAIIPIGTIQALVTYTVNILIILRCLQ